MRRSVFALAWASLFAIVGLAQEPEPGGKPKARAFRSEVQYVEVDAFVMDEHGDFLHDLTRDDFEIFEEGVRQEISAFAEISIPVVPRELRAEADTTPRDTATNERAFDGRVYVFLLDAAHTDPRDSARVRELASGFIEHDMADADVGAVVIAGGQSGGGQTFTSDKRLLLDAVSRFVGAKPASATVERLGLIEFQRDTAASLAREPSDALAPILGRDLDPLDLQRVDLARRSMETLQNVARGLATAHRRRKTILYFSEGIDYDTLDTMHRVQRDASAVADVLRDTIGALARYGVTVFPVDPRGQISGLAPEDIQMKAPVDLRAGGADLTPADLQIASASRAGQSIDSQSLDREVRRSQNSLRSLAANTGGVAVVDTNDFEAGFDRIVRANSQYYLMGYYPSDFRADGAYRKLEVRVRRPGVTVVAREGYRRPTPAEQERPRAERRDDTSREVRDLLDRPWAETGLRLAVSAAAFKAEKGTASVAVTIELAGDDLPFREEDGRAVNEIEVSLLALDQEGRVRGGDRMVAQPRLQPQTRERVRRRGMRFVRSLELPPGRYQLRVAAREAEEGRQGSVFYDIEVPDYQAQERGMSGVLVTSRQAAEALTASMDERVEQRFAAPPTATRAFAADDVVTAYAEVYGEPEPVRVVTLTTRLTRSDGVLAFRASEERASPELASSGRLAYRVDLPLRELSPGTYVLQIEARPSTGEPAAARSLAFEIAPRAAGAPAVEIAASAAGSSTHPASRIARVEVWLRAIEEHEPGSADAPARMVRSWTPEELTQLAADLSLVAKLIEDPKYPILWLKDPDRPARFFRAPYSTDDDARLRSAARVASLHCGPDPGDGAGRDGKAIRCALNRMLKRGAVLHADAAIRVEADRTPAGAGDTTRWQVRFRDGRQVAAEGAPGHWELARSLLENVTPSPERDDTVRLWYIATSAQGQLYERQTRQEDQAVEMFPADPHVLFLAGCLHETFASPMLQSLARSVHVSGSRTGIEPAKSELKSAEKLFRRALNAEPGFVEARVRLGRVLYLLGQAEEAARALREAVATLLAQPAPSDAPDTRLQLYLAEMFYGAAEEQLGQRDRAKASYTRAAELYPAAPSPRLALSQLALSGNEHALALEAVEHALLAPAGARERDDPWWRYHDLQGRDAAAWFARLYQSLADGM